MQAGRSGTKIIYHRMNKNDISAMQANETVCKTAVYSVKRPNVRDIRRRTHQSDTRGYYQHHFTRHAPPKQLYSWVDN